MGGGGGGGKSQGKGVESPSDSLFIGDLPTSVDGEQVKAILSKYGTVQSLTLTTPGSSGKIAALVTFASVEEATWIVNNLNGNIPEGLSEPIVARFKKQSGGKGKGGGGGCS